MILLSALAAVVAGGCFAGANILQQRVASTRPEGESLSWKLLADLARQRLWLAGIGLAVLSYGFQSVALAFGPLALVQPLILSELVVAIPLSARLYDERLGARDWLGVVAVAGGLGTAIAAASPSGGDKTAPLLSWLLLLAAVGGLVAVAVGVGRRTKGPASASSFAVAGAAIMGTQSALLLTTIAHLSDGFIATVAAWQTYALIAASIGGVLMIQSAYQAGPLSASMPVIDAVEPTVAVLIGVALFGEALTGEVWRLALAAAGIVVLVAGIISLDTSPVTHRLHEAQQEETAEEGEQVELTG